jgi:hypothetical protein
MTKARGHFQHQAQKNPPEVAEACEARCFDMEYGSTDHFLSCTQVQSNQNANHDEVTAYKKYTLHYYSCHTPIHIPFDV